MCIFLDESTAACRHLQNLQVPARFTGPKSSQKGMYGGVIRSTCMINVSSRNVHCEIFCVEPVGNRETCPNKWMGSMQCFLVVLADGRMVITRSVHNYFKLQRVDKESFTNDIDSDAIAGG